MNCPVCGDPRSTLVFTDFTVSMVRCKACGHLYPDWDDEAT